MPVVNLPDGKKVNFPDGTPPEEMNAAIEKFLGTEKPEAPRKIEGDLISPALRQGLSFGLDARMSGTAKAIGPFARSLWQGGDLETAWESAKTAYSEGEAAARGELDAYRKENPILSVAQEMLGGAVTGGRVGQGLSNLAMKAPGMAGTAGRIVGGGVAGATEGALYGAAAAKPGESGRGAQSGAIAGGALGMTIPAATAAYRGIRGYFGGNPASRALETLDDALRADDVTPGRAASRLNAMGPDATVADIGGVKTRSVIREAATKGMTSNRYNTFLDRRQSGQSQRIIKSARASMDSPQGALETIDDIVRARAEQADDLYRQAYAQPLQSTGGMKILIKNKDVQDAWVKGARLLDAEKAAARAQIAAGNVTDEAQRVASLPDMLVTRDGKTMISQDAMKATQVWDYVKRAMDDRVAGTYQAVQGSPVPKATNQTRVLTNLKNRILEEVDRQNSAFAQARAAFKGDTEALEAVNMGRRFLLGDQDMTIREIRKLSPQEQELFRVGAADAIRQKIEAGQLTSDAGKKIFGTPDKQQRLAAAFPTKRAYREFQRTIIEEAKKTRVRRIVPTEAGSQTQPRQAGAQMAIEAATGNKLGAIRSLLGGEKGMSPEVADEILRLAGRPGMKDEAISLLRNLEQQKQIAPELRSTIEQALIGGSVAGSQSLNRP